MKYIFLSLFLLSGFIFTEIVYARGGMPAKINPPGVKTFVFHPRIHMWAAYDANGNRVSSGVANGGAHYCHDVKRPCRTPRGNYRIISKGGAGCRSSRYPIKKVGGRIVRGGAPMPYCMFFTKNYSIHGYPSLTNANVSHGCIRISTSSALWLRNYLPIGAKVMIWPY